jgi:hypothetical protein
MCRTRHRKILLFAVAILIAAILPVALCIGIVLFVGFPFAMVPQDCMLIERSITGKVMDQDWNPIGHADVHIRNKGGTGFEGGQVDLLLHSDVKGEFKQDHVSVFGCDTLKVDVSAYRYVAQEMSYDVQKVYDTQQNIDIVVHLLMAAKGNEIQSF